MRLWLVMLAALICFQVSAFGQELVPDDEPAAPEKGEAEKPGAPEQAPVPAMPQKDTVPPAKVAVKPEAPVNLDPELQARIDELVRQLSAEDWQKREEATKGLMDIGEAVIPAVSAIRSSDDTEVKTRAETILASFHWVSPEDRARVDEIVSKYEKRKTAKLEADVKKLFEQLGSDSEDLRNKAVQELVSAGDAALDLLEELAAAATAQVKVLADEVISGIKEASKKFRTEIIEKLKDIRFSEFYLLGKLAAGSTDADREALIAEVISGVMGLAYWDGPSNVSVQGNQLVIDGEAFPLPAGPWSIQEKGDKILVNGTEYTLPFKFVKGISTAEVLGRIVAMDSSGDELRKSAIDLIAKRKEKDALSYLMRLLKPVEDGQTDTSLQHKILAALSAMVEDGPAVPAADEGTDKLNESIKAWKKWWRKGTRARR